MCDDVTRMVPSKPLRCADRNLSPNIWCLFLFSFSGWGLFFCSQLLLTNSKKNGTNFINETPEMERNTIAELIVCIVCVCLSECTVSTGTKMAQSFHSLSLSKTHFFPYTLVSIFIFNFKPRHVPFTDE